MMKSVIVIALALVVSVVNSQTFPHVSFMSQTLANHSYVDLSQVGNDGSGSDSVQCITDLSTCCTTTQGSHRGDWYFPNGTARLQFSGSVHESRGDKRVDLRRRAGTSPLGIYRCDIPTIAVNKKTDSSVRDIIYVGLYTTNEGAITLMCINCSYN